MHLFVARRGRTQHEITLSEARVPTPPGSPPGPPLARGGKSKGIRDVASLTNANTIGGSQPSPTVQSHMKNLLGSLIVSGTVGVAVTSALVVAQVPKAKPDGVTIVVTKNLEKGVAKKEGQKVEALPPNATAKPAVGKQARVLARPGNLENQVQQYMRQARPIVRAELIFARKICELDVEHFRRINQDAETAFKGAAKAFVEAQQQGRARVPGGVRTSTTVDGLALLQEGLASVMKKDLTSEQFAHYQSEVEKRDANRKQCAVRFLVDAIDRDLYLSGSQRLKLTESLFSHWDHGWSMCLEYLLYGNQFYPVGIDPYLTPFLDATQKKIWQAAQKIGGIGGIGGVFGGFMNDNDALEVELGEARKAEQGKIAPIRRVEVRQAPALKIEIKKAVTKPAASPE
jgi:hypothetical protein